MRFEHVFFKKEIINVDTSVQSTQLMLMPHVNLYTTVFKITSLSINYYVLK